MNNILPRVMLAAIACFVMGMMIPTVEWAHCRTYGGGASCTLSPMAASVGRTWFEGGTIMLGIAYQRGGDGGRR